MISLVVLSLLGTGLLAALISPIFDSNTDDPDIAPTDNPPGPISVSEGATIATGAMIRSSPIARSKTPPSLPGRAMTELMPISAAVNWMAAMGMTSSLPTISATLCRSLAGLEMT